MTQIRIKKARTFPSGEQFFPITHTKAVIDDNGNVLDSTLANLQSLYNGLTQSDIVIVEASSWPLATLEENTIYRVAGSSSYSDYIYNGTTAVLMATYNNAIDSTPTSNSENLVTSGGVYRSIPTIASNSESGADLEISDENGNVLVEFVNGEVLTKGFDSEKATQSNPDDSLADLNISDEDGNVLASFFNGNIKTKKFNSNKFFGKKVAFLGDSITAQGYYVNAFQSISGCYALNYGRGGSHLAKPIAADTTAFEVRYSEMDDDVDYVVVFGGTNDFGHSNVYKYNGMGTAPFGSYGDGTNDNIISFCAGVHRLFKGLSLKYVGKPIYIVTPIHHGIAVDTPEFVVSSNGSFTEGVNATTEKTFREYVDVIKEIATFYSLQVIDAYSYSRMNPIVVGTYFSDGLHLSQIGGEVFGKWLFEQIRYI